MKNAHRLHPSRRPMLLTLALMAVPALNAQTAPAPSAATLAKYDLNKNGRLDPSEIAAQQADQAKAASAVTTNNAPASATGGEEAVVLSPFEVTEANNGYYATNTMSGTRLNTKLEDLASSISVVTKQQMSDFAMLDINDIFNYEASTEGTGNYTAFEVDRNGMVSDQVQNNPQGANRIRGGGAANISLSGFATTGRVPLDPSSIDAVEISRGPNSSIFGIGEGSGTVNLVASSANFSRESTRADIRFEDTGAWRSSLDINRPLIRGKLGIRFSGVYQHEEARQKPSGFESRRFNAMVRFQPFRDTSIRAAFNSYHGVGNRASTTTPRDAISYWKSLGQPAWDPIANAVTINGVTTVLAGTTNPTGLAGPNFANPALYVDNGIQLWQISRLPAATATNGPNNTGGTIRMLETVAEPVRTGRPLFSTLQGVSSKDVYDYASVNLAAPNSIKDQVETTTVEFEQFAFRNDHHQLAFQFAWQREDADRVNRNVIGQASATGASYYLYIDPNTKLPDGRANPYFGRPYIGVGEPVTSENPTNRDSYRLNAAYVFDYTNTDKWYKWVGRHQVLAYYEERKTKRYTFRFRDVMVNDNPVYAPAGQPKGNQSGTAAPIATRPYYHFYVGDNKGFNADHGASEYSQGVYPFSWFNPLTNAWVTDQATLGRSGINEGSAGGSNVLNLIKTKGGILQSTFLDDRIVTIFGRRKDENRNKSGRGSRLKADGWNFDYAAMDGWVGDWALRSGETKSESYVVRPFRGWGFVERGRQAGGAQGMFFGLLGSMSLGYSKSDSFRPETPAKSITLKELGNPSSVGEDWNITLALGSKFVLRMNKYENNQIDSRAGQSAIFATRTGRIDFAPFKGENDATALQRQARNWVTAANPTFTTAQVATEVANIMKLPENYITAINDGEITETSDVKQKGEEFELSFNPSNFWTLRANAARQEALDANLSPNIPAWLAQRMPIWETIIDPRSGAKWLDTIYSGDTVTGVATSRPTGGTPAAFLINNVINPLAIARATEGKSRPQIREWRYSISTNYRLAGITEHPQLKRMEVGGAMRWEDKGAIGYYGIPVGGVIEAATALDANRPIYDKANYYFDAFFKYNTRLFNDRVRATFQLNVRNIQESKAHLRAVGAYPNGQPHTFRIIDPRLFIFTTSFDL